MTAAQQKLLELMTEDEWQSRVVAYARLLHVLTWHDNDSRRNDAGFLDLVLVGPGGLAIAELKKHGGRLSSGQHVWIDALKLAGVEVHVTSASRGVQGGRRGVEPARDGFAQRDTSGQSVGYQTCSRCSATRPAANTAVVGKGQRSAATVQKVLFARGWGFTFVAGGGKDLCPGHNREGAS